MATAPTTVLQPGATGSAVKALQDYLVSSGYMTQAQVNTGYGTYGPQTTAAVAALQKANNVDNSTGVGYYGPRTISALSAPASTGTRDPNLGGSTGSTTGTTDTSGGTSTTTGSTTGARNLDVSMPTAPTIPTYQAPSFSTSPVNTSPGNDNYTQFNTALMGLLKTQQTMGTKGFQEQGFNAQTAQNNKILAPTDPSLIGAAPGLQDSVRSGQASAIQPLVTQANNATQTFSEQIHSLGDAISAAKSFGDSYQAHQDTQQQNAQSIITQAMNIGGSAALDAVYKQNPDIFKTAGLDYNSLSAAAKAQEKYTQDKATYSAQVDQYNTDLGQYNTTQKANATTGTTASTAGTTTSATGLQSGKTFVSGNFQYPAVQYNQDKAALLATRGADGWVDPAVYLKGLAAWIAAGGVQSDFLQVFPVKDYVNPANTWPQIIAIGGGTKPKAPAKTLSTSTRSA